MGGEKQQAQEKKNTVSEEEVTRDHHLPASLWALPTPAPHPHGRVLVQEVPGGPQHPCRSHSLGATIQSPPKPVPLASPGTSSSLARGQEPRSHPEVIIFRLHSLKATKSRRVGGSRESRRSNHLHLSDSFMHSFQVSFAEALYQAVQSSPIGSAA